MKKTLFATLVLVLAGLFGVLGDWLVRKSVTTTADWVISRPAEMRDWLDDRLFDLQARAAIRCANDALEYSTVLGITRTGGKILIVVNFLQDYAVGSNAQVLHSIFNQMVVVLDCADNHITGWDVVTIVHAQLVSVGGYAQDGELSSVVEVSVLWVFHTDRNIANLIGQALNTAEFVRATVTDGRADYQYLAFFGSIPIPEGWVDGKLVVVASGRLDQYLTDARVWRAEQNK